MHLCLPDAQRQMRRMSVRNNAEKEIMWKSSRNNCITPDKMGMRHMSACLSVQQGYPEYTDRIFQAIPHPVSHGKHPWCHDRRRILRPCLFLAKKRSNKKKPPSLIRHFSDRKYDILSVKGSMPSLSLKFFKESVFLCQKTKKKHPATARYTTYRRIL